MAKFSLQEPAVALGSIIVVTGASGFIGSHIADQALAAGYKVRGTTRDSRKNAWLEEHFTEKYGSERFELHEVPDMTPAGAFDEVVKGASGFIHVANDMTGSTDADVAIRRAVDGALNAVKAADREPGISRFVYTSSSFAATPPMPGKRHVIRHDRLNEEALLEIRDPNPSSQAVYSASKVITERRIAEWIRENGSGLITNSVLPNANIGPIINSEKQGYPTSARWVKALWDDEKDYDIASKAPAQYFINVQDDARLHIIALAHPNVQSERIFAVAGPVSVNAMVDILQEAFPAHRQWQYVADTREDLSIFEQLPRAEKLLQEVYGTGFIGLGESVIANARDLASQS